MEKNSQGFPGGKMSPELRFKGFEGEWEKAALQDLVVFYSGLTYSPSDIVDKTGVLVLRSSNIFNGEIVDADNVFVKDSVARSENVKLGDIVVVVRNGSRSLIGKHAQIKNEMPDTVIGAFMTGIRSKTPSFFNALLSTSHFTDEIEKRMGATINQITMGTFRDMSFYIPGNIFERRKLGNLFEFFDHQFILYKKKLEGLKRLKHSMLVKMFPKEGAAIPEIRFKGFEGEWEKKDLGDFCDFSKGRGYSKNDLRHKGIPIILYGRLYTKYELCINQVDTFVEPIKGTLYSKGGEVVIPASGETAEDISIASAIMTPGIIIGGDLNVLYPRDMYTPFIALSISNSFTHNELSKKAQGKTIVHLHNSSIRCARIVCPKNIIEQTKIGQYFQSLDRLISLHEQKLNKLKNLKTSLLQKMFV